MKNNDLWEVYCEFCNQLVPKVSNNKDKSEFLRMAREGISMDGKVVNYNTYGLTLNILGFNVFLPSSLIVALILGSIKPYSNSTKRFAINTIIVIIKVHADISG